MSKERLEEIAYNVGISLDGEKAIMSSDDYDFLYNYALQQAERIQELETTVDFYQSALRDADRRVQELVEELYGNDIQMGYKHMCKACNKDYAKLLQKNKCYREALEEIARGRFPGASYKARQALEGEE